MKIAVIGGGISGISAAWLLAKTHDVTLFEEGTYIGGHAHTEYVTFGKKRISIDTAFEVFNPPQYPNLVEFFKCLKVTSEQTRMNLSVSTDDGLFEFSNRMPNGLFADEKNAMRPAFYGFLLEIMRFNQTALKALKKGLPPKQTLKQFLKMHKFSKELAERYVFPMVGSIWSTPQKLANDFPVGTLLTFLNNHQLFSATHHAKWHTVKGGSIEYVKRAVRDIRKHGGIVKINCPVRSVARYDDHVVVKTHGRAQRFDYVVFATHADTTLALIDNPTREEKKLLSAFTYEKNRVVLHSDPSFMPHHQAAWSAWNFVGTGGPRSRKVCLTYYMNMLKNIDEKYPLFVTLNPYKKPESKLMHKQYSYAHPLYTPASVAAQAQLSSLQNKNQTLFCGSYFGYGFHEDGIASAIAAVEHLGVRPPWSDKKKSKTSVR